MSSQVNAFFSLEKKGLHKAKVRCSLQTGSSGGIKWCAFVFLGCFQTPWNDRVERNVRFPPFIIMVTLKPNYSHLNSSLLAMLLLMAALKCTAWLGNSDIPLEFGMGMKQQQVSWASGMPVPGRCGGQKHCGTRCSGTHCEVILDMPPRPVPGRDPRGLGHITSETLQLRIVSKDGWKRK